MIHVSLWRISVIAHIHRCNEQIRLSPVRLVDQNNDQVGVVPTDEALRQAKTAGMDLVEVAPNERPPVCRIMDYGRFKYSQKRKKHRHREQRLKEIRLHPDIGDHDRGIKLNQAIAFLGKGDKVQFTMIFRGREMAHRNLAFQQMQNICTELESLCKLETPPRMMGRRMTMVVAPDSTGKKTEPKKEAQPARPAAAPAAPPAPPAAPPAVSPRAPEPTDQTPSQ